MSNEHDHNTIVDDENDELLPFADVEQVENVSIQSMEEPDELIDDEQPLSIWQIFLTILWLSFRTGATFSFSFQVVFSSVLLSLASEDEYWLAAVTLVVVMMNTVGMLTVSPLFAMSVIGSKAYGFIKRADKNNENEEVVKEKISEIEAAYRNGLIVSLPGALLGMGALYYSETGLVILGQNQQSSAVAQIYLRPWTAVIPPMIVRVLTEQKILLSGDVNYAMVASLSSLAVGTTLSAWLGLGSPKLGFLGVAIGCIVETYLTALLYVLRIVWGKNYSRFRFFSFLRNLQGNWERLREFILIGSAISFTIATDLVLPLVTSLLVGLIGASAQSTWNLATQVFYFMLILIAAFALVCCQQIGVKIGAGYYLNIVDPIFKTTV